MRIPLLLAAPLLPLVPLLSACSGSTTAADPQDAASAATLADLDGTWVSADDATVTFVFDGSRVGASAGCNTISGTAALTDGRLDVGGLTTTEIGCPRKVRATEDWLAKFLRSGPEVTLAEDALTLAGDGIDLELEPAPNGQQDDGPDDGHSDGHSDGVLGHSG